MRDDHGRTTERARTSGATPKRLKRTRRTPGRDRDDMKRRIIESTRELFRQKGYSGISMRKIAARMGCTTGAIYRYVPNKQSALQYVWEEDLRLLNAYVKGAVDQAPTAAEKIRSMFISYIRFWEAHPDNFRVAFDADGPPRTADANLYAEPINTYDALRQIIGDALAGRVPAPQDPDLALQSLVSAAHGVIALKLSPSHLPSYGTDQIAQVIVDGLLRGWGLLETPAVDTDVAIEAPTVHVS
jgi:AcrR family transcriptional regulator